MNRILLTVAVLLLAAALAPPAQGRLATGPAIRMNPPEAGAKAGQIYEGSLWLEVGRMRNLEDFAMDAPGWAGLTWTPVSPGWLEPDQPVLVEFSGVPDAADEPLRIIVTVDGNTTYRTFTVGGAEFEKYRLPRPLKQAEFSSPPATHSSLSRPGPALPEIQINDLPAPEKDRLSYDIRVRGRLEYLRESETVCGADGLTVRVYDRDLVLHDLLGSTVTDADGVFDFVVHWDSQIGETYPDLYVEFRTENSHVIVKPWFLTQPYIIAVGPWDDYQGEDLDIGIVLPTEEDDQAIPHLMSNYTRFFRYLHSNGHSPRFLRVSWPEGEEDGAFYTRSSETVHLARSNQWGTYVQAHEFGHHVHNCLAEMPTIDYCNEICDPDFPSDCGHCRWCEEDEDIAWTEGWAQYIGHTIPRTFELLYGTAATHMADFDTLRACQEDELWDDALITEGFTAATLVDIDDTRYDDDPRTPGFDDRLFMGGKVILDLLSDYGPMTKTEFLRDMMAEYPDEKENLWWTAMNNECDLDEEPPDGVHPIVCTSGHTPGEPSANWDLRFYWQRPDDDASGVRGYSVVMSGFDHVQPDAVMDQEANTFEYEVPSAATFYICVRTVDWAGRWQDGYTYAGPYIFTEPEPRNLVFEMQPGWDFYTLPRNAPDATPESCTLPPTLDGTVPTYWNLLGRNEGDLSTDADMFAAVEIDGVEQDRVNWGVLPEWCPFLTMNEGPVTVLGGAHTFAGRIDPDNLITETDETDNTIGLQLSWRPPTVIPQSVYYNATPVPDPTGGWDSVSAPFKVFNCFGMNFNSSGRWNAFAMWSEDPEADYDLRLHEGTTESQGGFVLAAESSNQPAGWTDAVLVNGLTMGTASWDAGIVNHQLDSASLKYQHCTSEAVALPDSVTEVMELNEYLFLREFEVGYLETGGLSLDLWTDPPEADVLFTWLDTDFTTGSILEGEATALTGADGRAHLEVEALEEGFTCLVICRQPKDGYDTLEVTYRIRPTLPDLEPVHLAGWHAPVIPRPQDDAVVDLIPLPTVLEGGLEQTWYNFAVQNSSTGMAWGAMRFYVGLDGGLGPLNYFHVFDIPGGDRFAVVNDGPYTVRGGRHTVVLNLDALNYMEELDETNNTYGEQYVWSPEWLLFDPVVRSAPPARTGGWEHIGLGQTAYFNCDGLRTMFSSAFWSAFAVMPGADSDVDVRLHAITTGVQDGFGANLAHSSWGMGQSDYVLYRGELTGFMPYDAGVLRIFGTEDYTVESRMDNYLAPGETDFGPVTMGAARILDIYETRLTPGDWYVWLENTSGVVDWGVTIHSGDQAFQSKTDALQDAAAWFAGPGEDEIAPFTLTTEEILAIAVWKVGAEDLAESGDYILHVVEGYPSSITDEELPAMTRVAGVYPNPFNPRTTIEFELARTETVALAVYDVTGHRIASLVQERLAAGRYSRTWQGQDEQGRRVASGVYFLRLQTDTIDDLKKVMLLK